MHAVFLTCSWILYLVIVAEVAIVSTYVQLCHHDHRWWWRAFKLGAAPSLYLFCISLMAMALYPVFYQSSSAVRDRLVTEVRDGLESVRD